MGKGSPPTVSNVGRERDFYNLRPPAKGGASSGTYMYWQTRFVKSLSLAANKNDISVRRTLQA